MVGPNLKPDILRFFICVLRGSSQVFLSSNRWTGFFFLVAVLIGAAESANASIALGAITGLIISTLTAIMFSYDRHSVEQGLWGYNAFLIGIAIPTFFEPTASMWILLAALTFLSVPTTKFLSARLKKHDIPVLTLPFVLLTWLAFALSDIFLLNSAQPSPTPLIEFGSADGFLKGFSQIFLINSLLSGFLIFIALFFTSKRFVIWSGIGGIISFIVAIVFSFPKAQVINGLWGYNPILTSVALGAALTMKKHQKLFAILGIAFAMIIQIILAWALRGTGLPILTVPFVLATWVCLAVDSRRICGKI